MQTNHIYANKFLWRLFFVTLLVHVQQIYQGNL